MFRAHRVAIFAYVLATAALGSALGALYGWLVVTRRFQRLTKHPWVYDLSVDGLTYAHVVTHVRHEERVLMYKGFLHAFGLQQDGRFSYIVLRDAMRLYMTLSTPAPETSAGPGERRIGNSGDAVHDPAELGQRKRRSRSYFVIEGEDIANVVFDRLAVDATALPAARSARFSRREAAAGLPLDKESWSPQVLARRARRVPHHPHHPAPCQTPLILAACTWKTVRDGLRPRRARGAPKRTNYPLPYSTDNIESTTGTSPLACVGGRGRRSWWLPGFVGVNPGQLDIAVGHN